MKKQLLLLSMISLLALTGCGDVSQRTDSNGDQVIVKIGDKNYTANELFEEYSNTSSGASQYYNAVYDVLIRAVQPITTSIKSKVEADLDTFVKDYTDAAAENGTTVSAEKSKALENAGVEDLEELEEVYTLKYQKSTYEENYYDTQVEDKLLSEFIEYNAPYHIRHILAKINGGDSLHEGTLDKDDATNIASIVKALASGTQGFAQIAKDHASKGDEGSANLYGDVGIMSTTTSFVSEFKYSIYNYDSLLNSATKENVRTYNERLETKINEKTDYAGSALIPSEISNDPTALETLKPNFIDYKVFEDLEANAHYSTENLVADYKEDKFLPRNIIFNEYLNNHGLCFIKRGTSNTVATSTRFVNITGISETTGSADDILCDEAGRPILVTRAGSSDSGYQGIHFIIIQKSPFASDTEDLKTYYDLEAHEKDVTESYVTFIKSTNPDDYEDRAQKIEDAVRAFDSNISYRIYEQALEDANKLGKVEFGSINDTSINELINRYIEANRLSTAYSAKETYVESWESYINLLKIQEQSSSLKVEYNDDYKYFIKGGTK